MMYNIKLEKFEGPLDLLLELIENEKMDIVDVSLSKVTDQYLEQFKNIEKIDPANLVDFLQIAAQLILIKSRTLLPGLEVDDEEEVSIDELKKRLIEYKRFKDMSGKVEEMYKNSYISFEKKFNLQKLDIFYPGKNLNLASLKIFAENLFSEMTKFDRLEKNTIKEAVSIKDKILYIKDLITRRVRIGFNEVLMNSKSRTEMVISFLALLELIKQKILDVEQESLFGNIEVSTLPSFSSKVTADRHSRGSGRSK